MERERSSANLDPADRGMATLPDGRAFDPRRPRSHGPLDALERAYCRQAGIPLAYDPARIGWVAAGCEDDLEPAGGSEAPDPGEAGGLRFRPWRAEDVPVFVALLDDAEVWRYLPERYPAPLSEELARDLIELSNAADHHEVRAVETPAGEIVGQIRIAFRPGDAARDEAEISYWLGRRWWGKGLGSRIVHRYSSRIFVQNPRLQSIFARVHSDNAASVRLLLKARYRQEGPAADDPSIIVYRLRREDLRPDGGRTGGKIGRRIRCDRAETV